MTKRMDWEKQTRRDRMRRNGTLSIKDETFGPISQRKRPKNTTRDKHRHRTDATRGEDRAHFGRSRGMYVLAETGRQFVETDAVLRLNQHHVEFERYAVVTLHVRGGEPLHGVMDVAAAALLAKQIRDRSNGSSPPSGSARRANQHRGRKRKVARRAREERAPAKSYVVVGNDGDPCPGCGKPTQIREHPAITEKLLRQRYYFWRWFYCTDQRCDVTTHLNPIYKVLPGEQPGGKSASNKGTS